MVEDERVTGTLASQTAADRDRRCIDNSGSRATPTRDEWAGHHYQHSTLRYRDGGGEGGGGGGSGSYGELLVDPGDGNGKREEEQVQEGKRMMTL